MDEKDSREKDDTEDFAGFLLVGHRCGARYVGRRRRDERSRSTMSCDTGTADFTSTAAAVVNTGSGGGGWRGLDDSHRLIVNCRGAAHRQGRTLARRSETDPCLPDEFTSFSRHANRSLRPSLLLQRDILLLGHVFPLIIIRREIDGVKASFVTGPPASVGSGGGGCGGGVTSAGTAAAATTTTTTGPEH